MRKTMTLLLILVAVLFVGCGRANTGNETIDKMSSKQLGEALVRALDERSMYKAQTEADAATIEDLTAKVVGIQFADPEFPAITRLEDGTGRTVFKKPGDYVKLPEPLRVPGDVPAEVDNVLSMGGNLGFKLQMAPVWTYRVEGNKLWLSSSTGVYGTVTVGKMNGTLDKAMLDTIFDGHQGQEEERDEYDRIIRPYIAKTNGIKKNVPADPGKSGGKDGQITWNNQVVGRQLRLNTSVESTVTVTSQAISTSESAVTSGSAAAAPEIIETTNIVPHSAVLRVGALVVQNTSVTYAFMYDTELDAAKEAIILNLLQAVKVAESNIALEF